MDHDQWRNYLSNFNGDIFEMIKSAIMVAASDHPQEFQNKRDMIAETLFSCELIKGCGCEDSKKQSINDHGGIATERVENDNDDHDVADVLRIKGVLDRSHVSVSVLSELLKKLEHIRLSVKTLQATGIGRSVRVLQKHGSKDVQQIAGMLTKKWKALVDEHIKKESGERDIHDQGGINSEKLEATKRRLKEAYEGAERMKKQRRIQVIEPHELTKKGFSHPIKAVKSIRR